MTATATSTVNETARTCARHELYEIAKAQAIAGTPGTLAHRMMDSANQALPAAAQHSDAEVREIVEAARADVGANRDNGQTRGAATVEPVPGVYDPAADPWKLRSLADAYTERPQIQYIAKPLMGIPSVGAAAGHSGHHKTNVFIDLAACVADGPPWLTSAPTLMMRPFETTQAPVVWYNTDCTTRTADDRFEAAGRAHGLPPDAPIYYFSFPSPPLDATNLASMAALADRIQYLGARLLVVDNLQVTKGSANENDSREMGPVVTAYRWLSERVGCAVLLIHHLNKQGGYRGSSAIENLVDYMPFVEREPLSNDVVVRAGKCRDAPIEPFAARYEYTHKPDSTELQTAKFTRIPVQGHTGDGAIAQGILDVIDAHPGEGRTEVVARVQGALEGAGRNRVRAVLDSLMNRGQIVEKIGDRNAKHLAKCPNAEFAE